MKPFALALLALLPATAFGKDDDEVPLWAKHADSMSTNVSIGFWVPECVSKKPEEIGANVSLTWDDEEVYLNFEVTLTKGVKYAEQLVWMGVPPPGPHADLPDGVETKDDLWDMLGLNGSESLTLKMRSTKEQFSLAVILVNAPNVPWFKDGKSLCILEKHGMFGADSADAMADFDEGFDLHGEHPHQDEENVAKEMKGFLPKNKKAAEEALEAEYKKDIKKGGDDQIDGKDTYTVDMDDVVAQLKDYFEEVPEGVDPEFTGEVFTDKTTGKPTNVLLKGNTDETKGAKIWINISNIILKDVPIHSEPVCADGQSIMEAEEAFTPLMQERRLFERAVKLRALEALNGAFSVVRTLQPHKKLPADVTQLWNSKDLEAAKMERHLLQRMHVERMMWQAAHAQYQRKTQMMLAGSGLLLAVMGFALFANKCRRSVVSASLLEALPRSDSEVA